ncbi:MAG: heme exporter protein CcmB [Betaproteobacteria bacterium]|nr:heme exporter protein CcmB [Betaproteobacteria bacterium]
MAGFALLVRRDLRLALRRRGDIVNVLVFFVIVASLFALGVGPEPNQLRAMAAGVVWVAALLAAMLSLPRLFAADLADGTLEQLLVSPQPVLVVVAAKIAAHWLLTGLPLALVAPLIGLQYHLPANALGLLLVSLLIGTPVLSLLGAAGAALVLGARGAGVLLGLLLLPLYVPVLVFGAGAVTAALAGIDPGAHLSLLGAFLAVSSLVGPWAACAALRVALD